MALLTELEIRLGKLKKVQIKIDSSQGLNEDEDLCILAVRDLAEETWVSAHSEPRRRRHSLIVGLDLAEPM